MKNNISQFDKCANCGACYNVCPVDAISVIEDTLFYGCKVNEDKCINCGKCVAVCSLNTPQQRQNLREAIGGWSKDKALVKKSSSGGAFSILAEYVLENKGIVFGAVFSEDKHEIIFAGTDERDLDDIRRSKYVESKPQLIFRKIKQCLSENRMVLFTGTPCQVAGLKRYLDKEYEKLITCDFACGGLPSHTIYKSYLTSLEQINRSPIENVNFRSGVDGWATHVQNIQFAHGGRYKKLAILDPYFYSFVYTHTIVRENCLDCQFIDNHYSDLVLADFWKWNDISSLNSDDTGISLILANSDKGVRLLDILRASMEYENLDLYKAAYNCRVNKTFSPAVIEKRETFFKVYSQSGLLEAAKATGMLTGVHAAKYSVRKMLSTIKHKVVK